MDADQVSEVQFKELGGTDEEMAETPSHPWRWW